MGRLLQKCQFSENDDQRPFQEPIDWRYLPYIRPIFQGTYLIGIPIEMMDHGFFSTQFSDICRISKVNGLEFWDKNT